MIHRSTRRARALRTAALGALAIAGALLLGIGAGPAQAVSSSAPVGSLSFSSDGTFWSETAPASLFPTARPPVPQSPVGRPAPAPAPNGLLVPGASRETTVWVRNDYAEPVTFSVDVVGALAGSPAAARYFGLAVHDGTGAGLDRTAFAGLGDPHPALASRPLAVGESLRIDVAVDLDAAADDPTMNGTVSFALRVNIAGTAETLIPSDDISGGGSAKGAVLSTTGDDGRAMLVAILTGTAMGATGWLLMAIARRRRERA